MILNGVYLVVNRIETSKYGPHHFEIGDLVIYRGDLVDFIGPPMRCSLDGKVTIQYLIPGEVEYLGEL